MSVVVITAIIASLFLVVGLAEPLAARLRLPYSVILAMIGIVIGAGASFLLQTELTDAFNSVSAAILNLPIRSNVFLYVFLPTLLFQVTLGMNVRRAMDDWVPIIVLAVVAVIFSTFVVGSALSLVSSFSIYACLLVAAIVSTTDPSAVVGIFRSIAAPRRLTRIIEGESLMNDAAAIALFGVLMGFVMEGLPNPDPIEAIARFPVLLAGGAAIGWLFGRIAVWVMSKFSRHELAQLSISVALPYLAYVIAANGAGVSGVIAVVAAGLTINVTAPSALGPTAWTNMREVWDLLAHWAGALIFVLAALLIPRLLEDVTFVDIGLITVVVIAALLARAVVLYGMLPLLSAAKLSPKIDTPYKTAILWGGLRGAVTLALALAVTESFRVPPDVRRMVGIVATGYTLFTLVVQGGTLRWVISRLGLDKLSPIDRALSNQVIAVALQSVREDVQRATEDYDLSRELVRSEAKTFGERLEAAVREAEDSSDILDRDRVTLGLIALAGAERDIALERFRERAVSSRLADRIISDADALIEATRTDGRTGYRRASRRVVELTRVFRFAVFLYNRLGISMPLARQTADRFELLVFQRLIIRDLDRFIDTRIRRIHGRRVAEILHELLGRRAELVDQALDGLKLQYPGYAEELERRFIRRTAIRLEYEEYSTLHEEGLIGDELYVDLVHTLDARFAQQDRRPKLDIALQKADLARQFPLFSELDEASLQRLKKALVTRYAEPGEIIVSRDAPAETVFFISSGAVELRRAGQTYRLGRGDLFGQLALLSKSTLRTEVQAIAPTTLLALDDKRFRRLLTRSPAIMEAVRKSAEERGIALDSLYVVSRGE
ncbi:cation:proton antiporter [Histidinibacterium aquaticum]|uniref:Cyclic nucleotide-binding domain-containing protein n=1 Tax=Histidinibacterium aquaticum TaxID=2613962 RepID=A0A5J5GKW7_9RHOB|nr:cation:proton antiporter [Histidinibacterium aquaticum]KAA9008780.1 cyclic nucleotide-binding domain-containing protein [Histidinibacterium aquaticum]